MVRHVIDLSKAFNKFYFESRIIGAEEGVKNARLLLVKATKQVIKNELELLGIECPEHM
jgi:arginyl-tRNA synthetase